MAGEYQTILEVPAVLFHASMFVFLSRRLFQRRDQYSSGWFVIFTLSCFNDLVQVFWMYTTNLFPVWRVFPGFYVAHPLVLRAGFALSGYTYWYKFFSHTLLSANRFCVFFLPNSSKIWSGRGLKSIIFCNYLIPLPCLVIRALIEFHYEPINVMFVTNLEDPTTSFFFKLSQDVEPKVPLFNMFASFALDCACIWKIRRHFLSTHFVSQIKRNDIQMFLVALTIFLVMLVQFLTATIFGLMKSVMATSGPLYEFQRVLSILLYLSGSAALFVLSKNLRTDYYAFYRLTSTRRSLTAVTPASSMASGLSIAAQAASHGARIPDNGRDRT